jgi:hypothetical protein
MPRLRPVPPQVAGEKTAAPPGRNQADRPPPRRSSKQASQQAKPQASPPAKSPAPSVTAVTKHDHLVLSGLVHALAFKALDGWLQAIRR